MANDKSNRKWLTKSRVFYFVCILTLFYLFYLRWASDNLWWLLDEECRVFCSIPENQNCEECLKCKRDFSIRSAFDEAGFIIIGLILAVGILFIKNTSIALMLAKISAIDILGTSFSIESMEKQLSELENKEFPNIDIHIHNEVADIKRKIVLTTSNESATVVLITSEIEKILATLFEKAFHQKNTRLTSINELLNSVSKEKIISEGLEYIVIKLFELQKNNYIKRKGRYSGLIFELGARILKLLKQAQKDFYKISHNFYDKVTELKIGKTNVEKITKEYVMLSTMISVTDSNKNIFPAENLSKYNFQITEKYNNETKFAEVIKVEPVSVEGESFRLILAIDTSSSMEMYKGTDASGNIEKFKKCKEAAKTLLFNLSQYSQIDSQVNIISFNSEKNETGWVNKDNFKNLSAFVDGLVASGGTALYKAIYTALDQMQHHKKDTFNLIILITDGANSEEHNEISFEDIKKKVVLSNVPIITIGYEMWNDSIKELSILSGADKLGLGPYEDVKPQHLQNVFVNILNQIATARYKVFWKPQFSVPRKTVNVQIDVNYESARGKAKNSTLIKYKSA